MTQIQTRPKVPTNKKVQVSFKYLVNDEATLTEVRSLIFSALDRAGGDYRPHHNLFSGYSPNRISGLKTIWANTKRGKYKSKKR